MDGYMRKAEWHGRANIVVYCGDCMEAMRKMDENEFDLAIVDPPYGGGQHFNFRFGVGDAVYENKAPTKKYFDMLRFVSKEQIVWGGNYFADKLPVNRCWTVWLKGQPIKAFSDFELAWTSFNETSRAIKLDSYGFNHADKRCRGEKTIHPTQKPVALYKRLLENYAKPGDRILDTHLGSGSIALACWDLGFDLVGYEIDENYFEAFVKRMNLHVAKLQLPKVG